MLTAILKSYLSTKYRYFHSRKSLEQWQDRQVRKHLRRILPKSLFYRELYEGLDLDQWRDFPTIAKKEMMENFDTLNTCGINKECAFAVAFKAEELRDFLPDIGGISVGLSSGTSGNRGLFLTSPHERERWAGAILAKVLPKTILCPSSIALFLRANNNLYTSLNSKHIRFEYYDMLNPFESHLERLNRQQPDILAAPPSILRLFAQSKQRLFPKKVISIAEVLDPLDQKLIEETFQQPVHQIYQATEGFLATTCRHGTLHLHEDLLVIQKKYIDQGSGRFHPIITDFNRSSQPILRYLLNDTLIEKREPCPCGSLFTAIECVEGRADDTFYLIAKNHSHQLVPVFPDFIRREIMGADESIEEYFAVQKSPGLIEISLCMPEHLKSQVSQKIARRLTALFDRMDVESPRMEFSQSYVRNQNNKLRRIERRYSIPC